MAIRFPFLRFLVLASLALAQAHAGVRAETVRAKLLVSAEVVVSCKLDASVPPVGSPERRSGGAHFSVTCTQAAMSAASACPGTCIEKKAAVRHTESVAERSDGGGTVATILF